MNKAFSIILLLALAASAFAQTSRPPAKRSKSNQRAKQVSSSPRPVKKPAVDSGKAAPEPTATPFDPEADRKRFDEAVAAATTAEKARLLRAFLDQYPDSELREEAFTYLITARAIVGNALVQAGDLAAGIASFKLAVEEAPLPVPERLFNDIISKIPGNLFYGNQRLAAMELARFIEKKVAANPKQLLVVAAFYLGIENGDEAKRVAEAAIAADPNSAAGYQALGLAHRLNFDLEESAKAYAKAAEVDPGSVSAKRSLAEMDRALGKAEAAATIYREIIAANENDAVARQGLILSLFGSGQQKEAEAELGAALQTESRNFALLTSVAYWYAANEQGDKAVEYAQKAVDIEPRYIWGHIVLARGLMKQNKPVEAERALLRARQYGNFPTLDYEIASARFHAGLYREAVEELQKSFSIKDGLVGTKLGGRVYKEEKSFQDLIAYERRASLLQPAPADRPETAEKLRLLLELNRKLDQPADESEVAALADEFVKGTDKMKLHRQLYVANFLLQKNVALPKVAELVKASVGNAEAGLDVAAPGAAVMASELYESRTISLSRNEVVLIPEVPRQTLSAILRGRIEELGGWTAFQQKNYPEAIMRLRRAISVLPDKSAWWRSSMWRLGAALEADGKDKEALDSYIKSYITDRPSAVRYGAIEALYRRINGNADGLEDKIGPNPLSTVASLTPQPVDQTKSSIDTDPKTLEKALPAGDPAVVASESLKDLPRHVPAKSIAARPEPKKPSITKADVTIEKEEPVANTGSLADPDGKKAYIKTETAASVTASELESAALAAPIIDSESAAVKDQPKTTDSKTETTAQAPTAPPVGIKEVSNAPQKEIAADPLVNKPDAVPATIEKSTEPVKSETDAAVAKQTDLKDITPAPDASAPQVLPKNEPDPLKKEDTPAEKETAFQSKLPAERTDGAKAEADSTKQNVSDPELPKEAPVSDSVQETAAKTDTPAKNDQSNPPVKTESPVKSESTDIDPANLLRDPFAITNQEPVKPPVRVERKPLIIVNDPFKPAEKAQKTKDLFEPVIIRVPSKETGTSTGSTRRRVIDGKDVVSDQRCSIGVSQDNIMLLSGGGSLGLLVRIEGSGETKDVTASSSSPRDIEVRPEPEIDGVIGRRFYVIKSISEKTGVFQVNFESPCGKHEITVHVR
jgi:tetratricopeptide (TPR) repeat protein